MDKALKEAIKKISPSKKEKEDIKKKSKSAITILNNSLRDAKAILGGSIAKDTFLKDVGDADIFVQFDYQKYKDKSDELSSILEKTLKRSGLKFSRVHGSRDYFQVKQDGFILEIIPILKINKAQEAVNITDISPLHVKWVNKNNKAPDEIRLAKAFAKANGLYGAESYIKGFSGYCLEILTIYYKGFKGLIKAAAKWEKNTVIDIENYHKDVFKALNHSKLESPLIVVDPVDRLRNVSASLSKKRYEQFIGCAKAFLKNPSKEAFEKKEISKSELIKKSRKDLLAIIYLRSNKGKEDVVGCRFLKVFEHISKKVKESGFEIKDSGWTFNKGTKGMLWFIIKDETLPESREWQGPPLKAKEGCERFKEKYKHTWTKDNRIYAKVKVKHRRPESLISNIIKSDFAKEKVNSIRLEIIKNGR